MDSHIKYNKKLMAEMIKDKLFGSMVRYKNKNFHRGTSVLNPNRKDNSCITKNSDYTLRDKRPSKGKLEYELRVLVGHAMVLDRLVEEIDREESQPFPLESDCDTLVDELSQTTAKIDYNDDSDEDEPYTYSYGIEEELYFDDEDISRLNKRQKQYINCSDCKMSTISNDNAYQDINLMIL